MIDEPKPVETPQESFIRSKTVLTNEGRARDKSQASNDRSDLTKMGQCQFHVKVDAHGGVGFSSTDVHMCSCNDEVSDNGTDRFKGVSIV